MAWPDSYDDWTAPAGNAIRNNLTTVVEQIYTAIEQIQHVIGLLPQGAQASIAARLDAIQADIDAQDLSSAALLDAHTTADDPHTGKYGKIVTPLQADGGGKLFVGGTPSATGPDHDAWVDESA